MNNSIKLFFVFSFFSSSLFAQEVNVRQDEKREKVEYGRWISVESAEATNANSHVLSDKISHKISVDPSNSLFGLLQGLQVLQNTGATWEDGSTLYVRGVSSINGKKPLILVDGFERSISNLTVQEIESISVLKDAASLALYGLKGANGVVYIKTKRGSEKSAPQIGFSYQFNMATPNRLPDFVDGYTYAKALNEGLKNDGLNERFTQRELDAYKDQSMPDFYPNVDWWNKSLRNQSFGDNVNFSICGGGNVVKYFSQINYLDDRGLFKPTNENDGYSTQLKLSKLNVRTNLDIKIGNNTKVKLNVLGNFSERNSPSSTIQSIFSALYQVPSGAFPLKTSQGLFGGSSVYNNNPVALISGTGTERMQTRTLYSDISLTQDLGHLAKGLSGTLRISYDDTSAYRDLNSKKYAYQSALWNWDTNKGEFKKLADETELSFASGTKAFARRFNFNAQLNYSRNWNKHSLDAIVQYVMDKVTNAGQNQTFANLDIVSQLHYVYNSRYIADVSLSGSASSILEPNDRWGIFPSVSLGWLLSEEKFMKADWLNMLKLRTSWGLSGFADFENNLYQDTYGGGNPFFFKDALISYSGMKERRLHVSGLTYEKSNKYNLGFDVMAWNKLSASIDLFYDRRSDILIDGSGSVSAILGIDVPKMNKGLVVNKGLEVSANWSDRLGNFKYELGGQFSFIRNTIKEMGETYRPYDYLKQTGRPLGQIFGYEAIGLYKSQDEIDKREVKQQLSSVKPGDVMLKDQNGDKIIDKYDMIALGYNNLCPEMYYSFNVGLSYKGFGLYTLWQGASNYSKILNVPSLYRPLINNNTISASYYNNRWSAENPLGKYPRLTTVGSDNNYSTNSLWVADASFLKLRTIELYYDFSENIIKNNKVLKGLRVFTRAHDLLSIDNLDIIDPEFNGADHPTMTQFTFGFNLRF